MCIPLVRFHTNAGELEPIQVANKNLDDIEDYHNSGLASSWCGLGMAGQQLLIDRPDG